MKSYLPSNELTSATPLTFHKQFSQGSKSAIGIVLFFLVLIFATPFLLASGVNPLIVAALCFTFFGLAGDAYFEFMYANESVEDDKSVQKTALQLLIEIVKKSPTHAMLNYFMAICILILAISSYWYADVSTTERLTLVLLVFLCTLMSIMMIWLLRFTRKK